MGVSFSNTQQHSNRYLHFFVVLGACALGFAFRAWYYQYILGGSWTSIVYPDEKNYYAGGAQNFLAQGWGYFLTPRSMWNAPLNVLWTSIWYPNYFLQKICNLALLSLSGFFVWDISRRFCSWKAGYLALALFTCFLPLCDYGPTILSEPLFVTLLLASFWLVSDASRSAALLISGMILGFATLVRPTTQFFPLFLIGLLFLRFLIGFVWRRELPKLSRKVLWMITGFILIIGPWSVKNVIYFGTPTISTGSGAVLYLGNDLRKNGDEPVFSEMQFDTPEVSGPYVHLDLQGDKRLREAAIGFVNDRPMDIFFLTLRKAYRFVFGSPPSYFFPFRDIVSYSAHNPSLKVGAKVFEVALIVLVSAVAILSLGFFRVSLVQFVLSAFVLYMIGLHAIAFPIPRLAVPIFPFLVILAGKSVFGGAVDSWQSRPTREGVGIIPLVGAMFVASVILFLQLFVNVGKLPYAVTERYATYFNDVSKLESADGKRANWTVASGGHIDLKPLGGSFDARLNQVIFLDVQSPLSQSTAIPRVSVLWRTESQRKFKLSRSKTIDLYPRGRRQLYRVVPSLHPTWNGKISGLRLAFHSKGEVQEFEIKRVWVAK